MSDQPKDEKKRTLEVKNQLVVTQHRLTQGGEELHQTFTAEMVTLLL
jgi:hypothetical protein